jgi:hypothetical protein
MLEYSDKVKQLQSMEDEEFKRYFARRRGRELGRDDLSKLRVFSLPGKPNEGISSIKVIAYEDKYFVTMVTLLSADPMTRSFIRMEENFADSEFIQEPEVGDTPEESEPSLRETMNEILASLLRIESILESQ